MRVKAIPCEVWSRIVGYFRPVKDWNPAKKQEYHDRYTQEADGIVKHFDPPKPVKRH